MSPRTWYIVHMCVGIYIPVPVRYVLSVFPNEKRYAQGFPQRLLRKTAWGESSEEGVQYSWKLVTTRPRDPSDPVDHGTKKTARDRLQPRDLCPGSCSSNQEKCVPLYVCTLGS